MAPPPEGLMIYEGYSFIDIVALLFATPQRIICFFSTTIDADVRPVVRVPCMPHARERVKCQKPHRQI